MENEGSLMIEEAILRILAQNIKRQQIKAVTSCSTHKVDQRETYG